MDITALMGNDHQELLNDLSVWALDCFNVIQPKIAVMYKLWSMINYLLAATAQASSRNHAIQVLMDTIAFRSQVDGYDGRHSFVCFDADASHSLSVPIG